jgi:ubiquinone/menaquinone biosynthesis C-methylase UbiE
MDVRDLVKQHYGAGDLSTAILGALAEAGIDIEHLTAPDVYPLDQLHAGGMPAARHALERLGIGPDTRVLDVGCGIGGPSRLAASYGAQVTGIDLTPEFVETATALTERVGLGDHATFVTTPGETLPFEDGSFDAAFMVHVGMNVPDKQAVFAEVHRVLVPGGRFALFEQVSTGRGEVAYPMPWADDARSSFVETVADYRGHLEDAGFTVEEVEDRTESTLGPPPTGPLSPMVVFGPAFAERIGHNVAATRAGLLNAVLIVARA